MLSRRDFAQRVLVAGAGLVAVSTFVPGRPALATGEIGKSDVIHIEPPHDPNTPIVHDYKFENYYGPTGASYAAGPISFTIMPSGDWSFSGTLHDGKMYEDTKQFIKFEAYAAITIVVGVKDSLGTGVAFSQTGKMTFGTPYSFSKSGNSKVIKENWKYFAEKHSWYGEGAAILTAVHPTSSSGGSGPSVGDVLGDVGKGLGIVGSVLAFL